MVNCITLNEWYNHFKSVLEGTNESSDDESESENEEAGSENAERVVEDDENGFMNGPISKEEVLRVIHSIKTGKAPGPDGVIGEVFKVILWSLKG